LLNPSSFLASQGIAFSELNAYGLFAQDWAQADVTLTASSIQFATFLEIGLKIPRRYSRQQFFP